LISFLFLYLAAAETAAFKIHSTTEFNIAKRTVMNSFVCRSQSKTGPAAELEFDNGHSDLIAFRAMRPS